MLPSTLKGLSSALAPTAKSGSIAGMVAKDEFEKYMGRRRGPEIGKVYIKQDRSGLETVTQLFEACATADERRILLPPEQGQAGDSKRRQIAIVHLWKINERQII